MKPKQPKPVRWWAAFWANDGSMVVNSVRKTQAILRREVYMNMHPNEKLVVILPVEIRPVPKARRK